MARSKRRRRLKRRPSRTRKRRRKAVFNRRRRSRAVTLRRNRISSKGLWARTQKKVLTYAEIFSSDIISNQHYFYRCNGMYDPDVAVGGNQPYGFDQMMTYYKHFTVIGAKMTMSCFGSDNNGTEYPMYLYSWVHDLEEPFDNPNNYKEMVEFPHIKWAFKGPTATGKPLVLTQHFSAKKTFDGIDIMGSGYRGTVSNDPPSQAYFCFGLQSAAGQNPSTYNIAIRIDYIAIFTDPITFGVS